MKSMLITRLPSQSYGVAKARRWSLVTVYALLISAANIFPQGSLTPPGPPAPTMKTLDQVEARTPIDATHTPGDASNEFIIAQAGSYYLTGDLNVAKTNGIHITAAGVTLDLNGFQIARTSGTAGNGITVDARAGSNCTVRNGSISFVGGNGFLATVSRGGAISHVIASNCAIGLAAGDGWRIDSCNAHDNTGDGIQTGFGCTISHCTAFANGSIGINIGAASTIVDSTAVGNQGFAGINTSSGCTLAHCTAGRNTSALSLSAGISTGPACTITACTAEGNTSTFAPLSGATGAGIIAGGDSTVQNCLASFNKGDGIRALNDCSIVANVSSHNGSFSGGGGDGAGVHVTDRSNRIEGNNVTTNTRGIEVSAAGNLIIKNSARSSGTSNAGNYVIAADNRYGPIVDINATGSVAVSGKGPFTSTLTSTDPWANFSY